MKRSIGLPTGICSLIALILTLSSCTAPVTRETEKTTPVTAAVAEQEDHETTEANDTTAESLLTDESGTETEGTTEHTLGGDPYDTILSDDAKDLCRTYFKAGDFSYRLEVTPGGRHNRNQLNLDFSKMEKSGFGFSGLHKLSFFFDDTSLSRSYESYNFYDDLNAEGLVSHTFSIYDNGSIQLYGSMEDAGTYYPNETLFMPEAFNRPLNDSDLVGLSKEDLRILRNQYYAVYGRKFENPELKNYFDQQPWYRANDSDAFDESIFSGLEKRNITFIKHAESTFDEKKAADMKAAYEALAPMPYLSLLPEHMEISVSLYSDSEHTTDKGIFYEAEGTISVPVIITPLQYETVMKSFGEAEICVNELTGETAMMKISDDAGFGDCMLFYDSNDTGDYYYLSYEPYSGVYTLWANSADTFFKPVYEGKISVLKGAEEEWYQYFSLPVNERSSESGAWRKMTFDVNDPYGPLPYDGNVPAFDAKGYLKALYFYGD